MLDGALPRFLNLMLTCSKAIRILDALLTMRLALILLRQERFVGPTLQGECPAAERLPGKGSGQSVFKSTHVLQRTVL